MQKVLVVERDSKTDKLNFGVLEKLLQGGWEVVSTENVLDHWGESPYTSQLVYILK